MFETLIKKLQEDKYITLETTPSHEPKISKTSYSNYEYER
jgi:hypothetical protein